MSGGFVGSFLALELFKPPLVLRRPLLRRRALFAPSRRASSGRLEACPELLSPKVLPWRANFMVVIPAIF
jgi:hypothetical protein